MLDRTAAVGGQVERMKTSQEILMIEDNANDAELAQRAFVRGGIANRLRVIASGEEALGYLFGIGAWAKHGATQPLLILLDLQLPKMSGLDFLREVKKDERTWNIPVVSLSMTTSAPAIVMCLQLGVVDHIIKPVDFAALTRVTKKLKLPLTFTSAGAVPRKLSPKGE